MHINSLFYTYHFCCALKLGTSLQFKSSAAFRDLHIAVVVLARSLSPLLALHNVLTRL